VSSQEQVPRFGPFGVVALMYPRAISETDSWDPYVLMPAPRRMGAQLAGALKLICRAGAPLKMSAIAAGFF
jgi:hypothetical protein